MEELITCVNCGHVNLKRDPPRPTNPKKSIRITVTCEQCGYMFEHTLEARTSKLRR